MEYKDVTETIIGCAYRVYNKMGFGFLESVYERGKGKLRSRAAQALAPRERKVKDLK